jgi:predicted GIY-YIG superfamily endonuclease
MMPPVREYSYFTYIMASRSHTLYIGVTSGLHRRVFQHKWKEPEGFTAKYNCDRLVRMTARWVEEGGAGRVLGSYRRRFESFG